jgi:hypothetical protein
LSLLESFPSLAGPPPTSEHGAYRIRRQASQSAIFGKYACRRISDSATMLWLLVFDLRTPTTWPLLGFLSGDWQPGAGWRVSSCLSSLTRRRSTRPASRWQPCCASERLCLSGGMRWLCLLAVPCCASAPRAERYGANGRAAAACYTRWNLVRTCQLVVTCIYCLNLPARWYLLYSLTWHILTNRLCPRRQPSTTPARPPSIPSLLTSSESAFHQLPRVRTGAEGRGLGECGWRPFNTFKNMGG